VLSTNIAAVDAVASRFLLCFSFYYCLFAVVAVILLHTTAVANAIALLHSPIVFIPASFIAVLMLLFFLSSQEADYCF